MMQARVQSSSTTSYDPMYCLSEHLDYFSRSVAGKHQLLKVDFDVVFGEGFAFQTALASKSSSSSQVTSSPVLVSSASPTSPVSILQVSSKPGNEDGQKFIDARHRHEAVVSPTTVTSTAIFFEIGLVTVTPEKSEKNKSRKRKMSEQESESADSSSTKNESVIASDPSGQGDIRRERNRFHAKRSRQRKRQTMSSLERSVQEIKAENAKLFQILGLSSKGGCTVLSERESSMDMAANERFVEVLKHHHNRVLSDDALCSLRELFAR